MQTPIPCIPNITSSFSPVELPFTLQALVLNLDSLFRYDFGLMVWLFALEVHINMEEPCLVDWSV